MSNKRKHSFDEYRLTQKEETEDQIRQALKILVNSNYENVTNLSKDVAKIINEIAGRDYDLSVAKGDKSKKRKPRPISNTTLLRNKDYRRLLDIQMSGQPVEAEEPSVSEVEILKIKIANLSAQNEILKNKLSHVSESEDPLKLEHSSDEIDQLKQFEQDQVLLVHMLESIMSVASDIFVHRDDGMYDYTGKKILDKTELDRWQEIKKTF